LPHCTQCHTPYESGERFCPLDGGPIVEADEKTDPLIGLTIADRYLIRRMIGKGGMGAVYEAHHIKLDKRVAVKFILDKYTEQRDVLARFNQEARTASRIGHDNIIDITDIGITADGRHYIVMEFLEGEDLASSLEKQRQLPIGRALHLIDQVLSGLGAAHEKGIVHRDMKPENVFLLNRRGKVDFVKIMDFGISKIISAHDSRVRLTETGAVIGTPIYMAPEQAQAAEDMDQRVDLYAVGVMLYEMLCGRPPFVAPSYLALVTKHLHEAPPSMREFRPEIHESLDAAVLKALEKEPSDRYSSAASFAHALKSPAVVGAAPTNVQTIPRNPMPAVMPSVSTGPHASDTDPHPAAFPAPTMRGTGVNWKRHKGPIAIVALALVASAGMVTFAVFNDRGDPMASAATIDAGPEQAPPADASAPVVAPIQKSTLQLTSDPSEADVTVDGKHAGKTPLLLEVAAGNHMIEISRKGYESFKEPKNVRDGVDATLHTQLLKEKRRGKRGGRTDSKSSGSSDSSKPSTDGKKPAGDGKKPAGDSKKPAGDSKKPAGDGQKVTPTDKPKTDGKGNPYGKKRNPYNN
jgi:serine/threonine-protein kinase